MGVFDFLRKSLQQDVADLMKADGDDLPDNPSVDNNLDHDDMLGRKAILVDPYYENTNQHHLYKQRLSRITNKTLKDVSIRDWLISSIIQTRCDTMLMFSRPQHKQFDTGFRVVKRRNHEHLSKEEQEEIAMIEDFIYHCGRKENTPVEDKMLFGEFLKLLTRDVLTFGHVAVEKVKTRNGGLHRFRPLPAESVFRVNKMTTKEQLQQLTDVATKMRESMLAQSDNIPEKEYVRPQSDISYYKYVQMSVDQTPLAIFGDEDLIFQLGNPQNFIDSNGYCYSQLELAIINVTSHLNVENWNANVFTHGYASRGILHLKGTVTPAQLNAFRRQFQNSISGTQHAWRTPVISGLDDIQWIPMAANAREMEYLNYNQHVMRAICTQFEIDPVELGLDVLTTGANRGPSQQANNEYRINYSRERGLFPILMMIEDMMNGHIIPAIDENLAQKYMFKFVGYTDETPQTHIAQLQAEMTVHSSMNDLLKSVGKVRIDHRLADLPLNATFWQLADKYLTKGEIREHFLGDEGASERRELQYLAGDPSFLAWNQLLMTIDRSKQQQKLQEQQQQLQEKQDSREGEKHDAEMAETRARHAHAVTNSPESLKESAKAVGAATEPLNIGGKPVANPLNTLGEEE